MRFYLLILSFLIINITFSQIDFYLSPGFGVGYSKGNLTKLQDSYSSYLTYLDNNFASDSYTADPNWNTNSVVTTFSFHLGIAGEGVMAGIAYFPYRLKQERYIKRESGYGRKFVWKENRNELLFDVGYGSKFIDAFGLFGVNFNNYTMASYQIYPDGTESINGSYNFNGLFKQFDAGLSYGLGLKIKPLKFIAIDVRYIIARDNLPFENTTIGASPALADNSLARTPGTNQYPQDYNKPLAVNNGNEIVPNFKRNTIQLTLLYYFRSND